MPAPAHPYTTFDAVLDEHEYFQPALDRATTAAERLARAPAGPHELAEAREAAEFLWTYALPHMDFEETTLFPKAQEHGASDALIGALLADHLALRDLAARIRAADAAGEAEERADVARLLREFVLFFERHIEAEEELFAQVPGVRDDPV